MKSLITLVFILFTISGYSQDTLNIIINNYGTIINNNGGTVNQNKVDSDSIETERESILDLTPYELVTGEKPPIKIGPKVPYKGKIFIGTVMIVVGLLFQLLKVEFKDKRSPIIMGIISITVGIVTLLLA